MAKYLLVYHGGSNDGPPDESVMAQWMSWFGSMGPAVVDGGNPVGRAWTVRSDGTVEGGGANPAAGYSIISADSMDAALVLAKGCPVIAGGGSVELCETFDVG